MPFPTWVDLPEGQSDKERASKRIRFLICRAAILTVPECTLRGLATHCEINESQLSAVIKRGAMPMVMAEKIERCLGRDVVRAVDLVYPLEIAE